MNKESGNKGFSLVELIVVIAIMAILVGVLAPAYLKYVEKSRKSADIQAISEIINSAEATATDEEYHVPSNTVFKISANNGSVSLSITNWDTEQEDDSYRENAEKEWQDACNQGKPYYLKAKEYKSKSGDISGTYETNGILVWRIDSGDTLFTAMTKYSKALGHKFSS